MIKRFEANKARLRRHQRTRRHLEGSSSRPRLNVFRSGQHIYAQVIDDSSGLTLASASSLDASLHDFKPAEPSLTERAGGILQSIADKAAEVVEAATDALPGRGKSAKTEKAQPKGGAQAKGGGQASKGGKAVAKVLLPAGQKRSSKTPVEALEAISNNRKVALAREVGKLVAERAKEKGVTQVVFDRGGYTYHGRVAALAEGAREVGLSF